MNKKIIKLNNGNKYYKDQISFSLSVEFVWKNVKVYFCVCDLRMKEGNGLT